VATNAALTLNRTRVRPPWGQPGELADAVVRRGEAPLHVVALAEEADRLAERAGEVLEPERVRVAGGRERRALVGALGSRRSVAPRRPVMRLAGSSTTSRPSASRRPAVRRPYAKPSAAGVTSTRRGVHSLTP